MNDRLYFAGLLHACHLGLFSRQRLITLADERIVKVEKPEDWLIELSMQGDSSELNQLAQRERAHVNFQALRLAYLAWEEQKFTDAGFHYYCKALLHEGTAWYLDLLWVDNEFDLVETGIKNQREARRNIRVAMQEILQQLPHDWADSDKLVELLTFTDPVYHDNFILLFLHFPLPIADDGKGWAMRREPVVIVRPDGKRIRAVAEFTIGLVSVRKSKSDLENLRLILDRCAHDNREPSKSELESLRHDEGRIFTATLRDVTSAEVPTGSQLLVPQELWNAILS
jgi:hypothetical protein